MLGAQLRRSVHSSCSSYAKKTLLHKLRKRTGVSIANCREALKSNDNDLSKAEEWLANKAQTLGWAKVAELAHRQVRKGLVGLALDKNHAALIEVGCETEFATRNKQFLSLVTLGVNSCLSFAKLQPAPAHHFTKLLLDEERLSLLEAKDGKSLADHTALVTGSVGEKIQLQRAACIITCPNLRLNGFVHPAPVPPVPGPFSRSLPMTGDYASVIVFNVRKNKKTLDDITRQICQHIIGMSPSKVGSVAEDSPAADLDSESTMIFQEFLFNPEVTVEQFLEINGLEVFGFERFECGELRRKRLQEANRIKQAQTES